jgi:hypothetical protein
MCAAPFNNKFWKLRSKHGRDKIFSSSEQFLKSAYEYFEQADKSPWYKNDAIRSGQNAGQLIEVPTPRPFTIQGLCIYLGITEQTFLNYEKNQEYKDFFEVFTHVREIIENNQFEGATVGAYNANIIARKLGLSEKQDLKSVTDIPIIKFVNASKQFDDHGNPLSK